MAAAAVGMHNSIMKLHYVTKVQLHVDCKAWPMQHGRAHPAHVVHVMSDELPTVHERVGCAARPLASRQELEQGCGMTAVPLACV